MARIGAADLGIAGLYGRCGFNVTILFYADIFYRDGILNNQTQPAHFAAGDVAIGLILAGLVLILARNRIKRLVVAAALALMASAYIAGAAAVVTLGTSEDDNGEEAASGQQALSQRPHR